MTTIWICRSRRVERRAAALPIVVESSPAADSFQRAATRTFTVNNDSNPGRLAMHCLCRCACGHVCNVSQQAAEEFSQWVRAQVARMGATMSVGRLS